MTPTRRLGAAILVAAAAFAASVAYRSTASDPINDLHIAFCGAEAMLRGVDPYGPECVKGFQGTMYPSNPLTTVLAVMPFTVLGFWWGPIVLWSLVAGLLAWALLAKGETWRLLTLTSMPFVACFFFLQWAPLILAVAFVPVLLPLLLIKPHVGLPVLATNLTRSRVVGCVVFAGATLIADPTWPVRWLPQISAFDGFIPALTVWPVGLLLLTAIVRWRRKDAWFFLLMALVPQRGLYDLLPLWYLVDTRRQLLLLNGLSWLMMGVVLWGNTYGVAVETIRDSTLALIYVPLLVKVCRKQ